MVKVFGLLLWLLARPQPSPDSACAASCSRSNAAGLDKARKNHAASQVAGLRKQALGGAGLGTVEPSSPELS